MINQLLAGAIALAVAAGITTSAMAFGHGGGFHSGFRDGGLHSGYSSFRGGHGGVRGSNFSGVRGFTSWRDGAGAVGESANSSSG
jgi:hypothetical protein